MVLAPTGRHGRPPCRTPLAYYLVPEHEGYQKNMDKTSVVCQRVVNARFNVDFDALI